jgi:hypothetical protein
VVQRLNLDQTRQLIRDLLPQGLDAFRMPEPVQPERLEEFCALTAASPAGRVYGWFDSNLEPRGFFAGLIVPDPYSAALQGLEVFWWTAPRWRGRPSLALMQKFEEDCKEAGCKRVIFGFTRFVEPEKTRKLYGKLGYEFHSELVSKEI